MIYLFLNSMLCMKVDVVVVVDDDEEEDDRPRIQRVETGFHWWNLLRNNSRLKIIGRMNA